jgi:hypothetical protein
MTCSTLMSILRGGVREVFAVDSEVLLWRPLGFLRPFPFIVTVLAFVCFVLGSMLEVISGADFFAVSALATLIISVGKTSPWQVSFSTM